MLRARSGGLLRWQVTTVIWLEIQQLFSSQLDKKRYEINVTLTKPVAGRVE